MLQPRSAWSPDRISSCPSVGVIHVLVLPVPWPQAIALQHNSGGLWTPLQLIMDQLGGAEETGKKSLIFIQTACSLGIFSFHGMFFGFFEMTWNCYSFMSIRKWPVVIFTVAFWGTESKWLSYENQPYTVQMYGMWPFSSKHEVMMLLEQEDGCATNPSAVNFCLPCRTREQHPKLWTGRGSGISWMESGVLCVLVTRWVSKSIFTLGRSF